MFLAKVDDTHEFDVKQIQTEELDDAIFLPVDAGVHMHTMKLK